MSLTPRVRDSGNWLLDRLPADEFDRFFPILQRVDLSFKQIVHQFDVEVPYVYFPTSALISLLTVMEDDDPVEAGTVGREGFVGLEVALGVETSAQRAICQLAGQAYRLPAGRLPRVLEECPMLERLVQRYALYVMRFSSQAVACNTLHTVESRACRWLLVIHDQAGRDEFSMTHEFLAFMLGVRRQTVTVLAGALASAGLLDYRRGVMTIRDRDRLEESACECYATVHGYYRRIFA